MNPTSCETRSSVRPEDPEWVFPEGYAQVVVNVPNSSGEWTVWRVSQTSPIDVAERAFTRALLRLALQRLDETEPTSTNGVSA